MPKRIWSRKRAGTWLGLLLFLFLPGCVIPYGFPTVSQVPAVYLGEEAAPVYAFRVDSTREWVDVGGHDDLTLTQVPLLGPEWVPPQTRVSATYGCFLFGPLTFPVYTSHTIALRLYRPGYELVEIDSWDLPSKVAWQKALDLEAQERALDCLFLMEDEQKLGTRRVHAWFTWDSVAHLKPGSASAAHREALLFGASEYERLAACVQPGASQADEARKRLTEKADHLRALAGEERPHKTN